MRIRTTIQPGDIGALVRLHGLVYSRECNLDVAFEGYVAAGLGAFATSFDGCKDRLWLAEANGELAGSVAIVGVAEGVAQLRWYLVHPDARGAGLGRTLLREALAFCRERKFSSVFLWTISELTTAAHLYRDAGFTLTEEKSHEVWGALRTEQRYDLRL
jgi:N-acetylglutamate synthase-like GNAT family acetyltransferase